MKYDSSIVELPTVRLCVMRADSFPDGIQKVWHELMQSLGESNDRICYGFTVPENNELAYYAAVVPHDDADAAAIGLPTMEIEGGRFAKVELENWPVRIPEIGRIFDYLITNYSMQPRGKAVEYYANETVAHLLVPLVEEG